MRKHARPGQDDLLHVRAEPFWGGPYWADLEVAGSATLWDLDAFLRRLWLECCGHLSEFRVRPAGSRKRSVWADDEVDIEERVAEVFRQDVELIHLYDFGSSTELRLRLVGRWRAGAAPERVRILARNDPPFWPCGVCGEQASEFCTDCNDMSGFCCPTHAESHPCGEEIRLPVVNSPRMGVCGYTGGPFG